MDSFPLAKHFDDASKKVKTDVVSRPDNDTLLVLYGLYKQATEGDVNIPEPSFYQFEAKAKYNAWKSHKGKSTAQAQHEYVEAAKKILPESITKGYN